MAVINLSFKFRRRSPFFVRQHHLVTKKQFSNWTRKMSGKYMRQYWTLRYTQTDMFHASLKLYEGPQYDKVPKMKSSAHHAEMLSINIFRNKCRNMNECSFFKLCLTHKAYLPVSFSICAHHLVGTPDSRRSAARCIGKVKSGSKLRWNCTPGFATILCRSVVELGCFSLNKHS